MSNTAETIFSSMLELFETKSGRSILPESDMGVRLYAAAVEAEALYHQADWVLRQCFPQTASETYLDLHAELRGIARKGAVASRGKLRFYAEEGHTDPILIPQGTVVMDSAMTRFETTESGTIETGVLFADLPAAACAGGTGGNILPGTATTPLTYPAGIVSCTNSTAFSGGEDAESDDALRARVLDGYKRLPNGANAAFYESEALSVEGVSAARAVPRARGRGTVDVYITDLGGVPSEALIDNVSALLAEKREIAVDLQVLAPTPVAVNVTGALTLSPGADPEIAQRAAEEAVRTYFTGKRLASPIYHAVLQSLILAIDGVENVHLSSPSEDLPAGDDTLPTLGTLSLEVAP
ncbi:baseplate J/gp47 family protein [Oscillospiraceae bacterium OttesenSCG-928-F05]|nr:baseplate J/gp47 family protein [Oscillospiraceae bacterium OttesenSCG-928-F05]